MISIDEYRTRVYSGVLGKTIGVYMGRPFEGWPKVRLEERFGMVSGYLHEELDKPLVVADDDLSGTFTFVRALEDSGCFADTTCEAVGDAWLNYVIENKSIFWWGGMAHSTEHTAFLRLLEGVRPPRSGSSALNGKTVAEQIGAQIFIDAFGMVCPGDPHLAAKLARAAASVGHDGEAVHAAVVVAALCAAAFVESNLADLLDRAITLIPADSLVAQVHRDVRAWARADGDWRLTFDRIDERYGYHIYGGNCHVIPNHALMVLAWAYAGDDFYEAQRIVNSAGWDTDCNAANVGSVMGIALGLDAIDERYPFREPVADRLILPTAEGTFCTTDCLIVARHIATIGERVMAGRPAAPVPAPTPAQAANPATDPTTAPELAQAPNPPAAPAWHHFGEAGAVHGWQSETRSFAARSRARLVNVEHPDRAGARCLRVSAVAGAGIAPALSTPILARPTPGYAVDGCPRIMPGATVSFALAHCRGTARLVSFVRYLPYGGSAERCSDGPSVRLETNPSTLVFTVPTDLGGVILDLGLRVDGGRLGEVGFHLASVDVSGSVVVDLPEGPVLSDTRLVGWLHDCDTVRGDFPDDPEPQAHLGHNKGRGLCVTGTRDWRNSSIAATIGIHGGDACGLVVRYQGRERYYAAIIDRDGVRVIRREYGTDHLLATTTVPGSVHETRRFRFRATADTIELVHDGKVVVSLRDSAYADGGAGLLIEQALVDVHALRIEADLQ